MEKFRFIIIIYLFFSSLEKSFAVDPFTNSLPTYNTTYSAEPFYGQFQSKLIKLTKQNPGTNSINTFAVPQTRAPFRTRALRDLNGDGHLDVLGQTGQIIHVAYGPSFTSTDSLTNSATNLVFPLPAKGFKLVATGDIDGDEDIDLILQKGKRVTAYLFNENTYQQIQLLLANSLAPRSKVIGISNQDAKFVEIKTLDQAVFTGGNGFNVKPILNTVAIVSNLPSLVVKVGREIFQYTNSNGLFFPSELPIYTLQPKEKVVGIFNTGLNARTSAVSTKTTIIIEPVLPGESPRNLTVVYSNNIVIPSIVIQKGKSIFALSLPNPSSTPLLVASNRAGVKIIGPR